MLIGFNRGNDLCEYVGILEPRINREATKYIENNREYLIKRIRDLGIKELDNDLLNDVYISLMEAENDGHGYDCEYFEEGKRYDKPVTDVKEFVIGRIKGYAKNAKYRTDCIEYVKRNETMRQVSHGTKVDELGNVVVDKNGNVKSTRKIEKYKTESIISVVAASFDEGKDEDFNDNFQKSYAMASISDSTADIVAEMSVREKLENCIDICDLHEVDILNILRNVDKLADLIGQGSKRKKTANEMFRDLTRLVMEHSDLAEDIQDLLEYSSLHKANFEALLAQY